MESYLTKSDSIKDLRYILLPSKIGKNANYVDLHNKVYDFWNETWTETFNKTGSPESHWHEHYLRQDVIAALMHGNEVVGCHLYTLYNLNSKAALQNDYFTYYSEEALGKFRENKIQHVMSMEYLCANPKWRKSESGLSIGEVLIGTGLYVSEACGYERAVGTAINEAKVDIMAAKFGADVYQDGMKKYGYTLSLVVMPTQPRIEHKDPAMVKLLNSLWANRTDYTGRTHSVGFEELKQAA